MPSFVDELKSWCSTLLARIAAFLSVRLACSLQTSAYIIELLVCFFDIQRVLGLLIECAHECRVGLLRPLCVTGSICWYTSAHRSAWRGRGLIRTVCTATQARQETTAAPTPGRDFSISDCLCRVILSTTAAPCSQHHIAAG